MNTQKRTGKLTQLILTLTGIIAKLETSSYQNSVNISFKIDTCSNSNILPSHKYKNLFPRLKKKL